MLRSASELRARLADARILLVFTPDACGPNDPQAVLEALIAEVDIVQVRPKSLGADAPRTSAADAVAWCRKALNLAWACGDDAALVMVNDRVDVACALAQDGLAGVHLGQDDCDPAVARSELGETPLIGLSTHDARQVALASEEPVDYLGFGPTFATTTKGYPEGLGPERAWIAAGAAGVPLFPIGGIELANINQLATIGRAAVGSALLAAPDPVNVARQLRRLLSDAYQH